MKTRRSNRTLTGELIKKIDQAAEITRLTKTEVINYTLLNFIKLEAKEQKKAFTKNKTAFQEHINNSKKKEKLTILLTYKNFVELEKAISNMQKTYKNLDKDICLEFILFVCLIEQLGIFSIFSVKYTLNRNTINYSKKIRNYNAKLKKKVLEDLKEVSKEFDISISNLVKIAIENYRTKSVANKEFFRKNAEKSLVLTRIKDSDFLEIKINSRDKKNHVINDGALNEEVLEEALETLLYSNLYTNVFYMYLLNKNIQKYNLLEDKTVITAESETLKYIIQKSKKSKK